MFPTAITLSSDVTNVATGASFVPPLNRVILVDISRPFLILGSCLLSNIIPIP